MPKWDSEIEENLRKKIGSKGWKWSSLNAPSTWNSEIVKFLRTKLAQGAEIGLVWMPQALTCQMKFRNLRKFENKIGSRGRKWSSLNAPEHSHTKMKFKNWRKLENKIGLRGRKWSSLNAPSTYMLTWNSEIEENLRTKLA